MTTGCRGISTSTLCVSASNATSRLVTSRSYDNADNSFYLLLSLLRRMCSLRLAFMASSSLYIIQRIIYRMAVNVVLTVKRLTYHFLVMFRQTTKTHRVNRSAPYTFSDHLGKILTILTFISHLFPPSLPARPWQSFVSLKQADSLHSPKDTCANSHNLRYAHNTLSHIHD